MWWWLISMTSFEDNCHDPRKAVHEYWICNMMMILVTSFEDLRNDWALSQQEGSFLFNDLRAEESESFFCNQWWLSDDGDHIKTIKEFLLFNNLRMPMAMMAAFVVMNNLKMMFFCDHKLIYCHLFSPERKLVHLVFPRLASNRRNSFWNGIWSNTEGDQILILSSRWWSDYCGQILIQLECVFPAPASAPKK